MINFELVRLPDKSTFTRFLFNVSNHHQALLFLCPYFRLFLCHAIHSISRKLVTVVWITLSV